ncbi:MAG: response regulator [Clostridia bacterium]|nr:response regulator [Clostridia bacterium]
MYNGKKIMIVDDSDTVRFQVKMILDNLGVRLMEAANEIGMLNGIEEYGSCVDLVIMDLTLKNENGFDLIKKLKDNQKYKDIPVLILTEHVEPGNVLQAKGLGVSGYLRKPVQKDDLLSRVKVILGNA